MTLRRSTPVRVPARLASRGPAMGAGLALVASLAGCGVPGDDGDEVLVDEHQRVCVAEDTVELPPEQWRYLPESECDDDYDGRRYGGSPFGLVGTFLILRHTHPAFGRAPLSSLSRRPVAAGTRIAGGPEAGVTTSGARVRVPSASPSGRAGLATGRATAAGG